MSMPLLLFDKYTRRAVGSRKGHELLCDAFSEGKPDFFN